MDDVVCNKECCNNAALPLNGESAFECMMVHCNPQPRNKTHTKLHFQLARGHWKWHTTHNCNVNKKVIQKKSVVDSGVHAASSNFVLFHVAAATQKIFQNLLGIENSVGKV